MLNAQVVTFAADDRFAVLLTRLDTDATRIVVEVTEHAVVDDYDALAAAVQQLRCRGVRLAVDDAGAGYASMQHILRLRPADGAGDEQLGGVPRGRSQPEDR